MAHFQLFTSIRYDPAFLDLAKRGLANVGWNQRQSVWYMLDYHRDRMLRAASYWGWEAAIEAISGEEGLERLQSFLHTVAAPFGDTPHRVKILMDQNGKLDHMCNPVPPVDMDNLFPSILPKPVVGVQSCDGDAKGIPSKGTEFEVLVDYKNTMHTEFTHFKTTNRTMYDDARNRHQLGLTDKKEVLIVNDSDGSIMEASFTTPYFWRDGRWVTPPVSKTFRKGDGNGGNDGTTRRWALERGLVEEETVFASSLADGEECWISNGVRGFTFGRVTLQL